MSSHLLLAYLAVALAAAVVLATYALAGARVRHREVWESERAE